MNIDEMKDLQDKITRAFVKSCIPSEWEQLANISWELEKLEKRFNKFGYAEEINNDFMKIKSALFKMGVVR
ncbi:MAG: hypothetical protein SPF22_00850 [Candidatus Onthovivens sp.]|nr:hypothetical protein [Candidatus Onthovivens sp.]